MKNNLRLPELILLNLVKVWPANKATLAKPDFNNLTKEEYSFKYALDVQFKSKLKKGIPYDFYDKRILEIGCGHGGIATFHAINGAKEVVGIDISDEALFTAEKFKKIIFKRLNISSLNLSFLNSDATDIPFTDGYFDIILAENVFEHFMDYEGVLKESFRLLGVKGRLIVPIFSSIHSQYAYHVKSSMKLPWIQWFFSDLTIINVLKHKAELDPKLYDAFPGLKNNPIKISEIRRYNDLNDISYKKFKEMAIKNGFEISYFETVSHNNLKVIRSLIRRIPFLNNSIFSDIFSTGAKAILIKK